MAPRFSVTGKSLAAGVLASSLVCLPVSVFEESSVRLLAGTSVVLKLTAKNGVFCKEWVKLMVLREVVEAMVTTLVVENVLVMRVVSSDTGMTACVNESRSSKDAGSVGTCRFVWWFPGGWGVGWRFPPSPGRGDPRLEDNGAFVVRMDVAALPIVFMISVITTLRLVVLLLVDRDDTATGPWAPENIDVETWLAMVRTEVTVMWAVVDVVRDFEASVVLLAVELENARFGVATQQIDLTGTGEAGWCG